MKLSISVSAVIFAFVALQPVSAVTINSISYDTRSYTAGTSLTNAAAYVSNWNTLIAAQPTPPAGYGSTSLSVWDNVSNQLTFGGAGSNIAYHAVISLIVGAGETGNWDLRFGIDFGLGGVLIVDGVVQDFRNSDIWWSGSYADAAQILATTLNLGAGAHTIEVYGLEGCCDGATQAQYRTPGGAFTTFDAVPEPSTWALALAGLAISIRARRLSAKRRA